MQPPRQLDVNAQLVEVNLPRAPAKSGSRKPGRSININPATASHRLLFFRTGRSVSRRADASFSKREIRMALCRNSSSNNVEREVAALQVNYLRRWPDSRSHRNEIPVRCDDVVVISPCPFPNIPIIGSLQAGIANVDTARKKG